jgi:hypothetical protein
LSEAQTTYGGEFREETNGWLSALAAEAETRDSSLSIDFAEAIEAALSTEPRSWGHSLRNWFKAPIADKVRAILAAIRKRCPPWEMRAAVRWFTVISAFDSEIVAYYEVDHVKKRMIFRRFEGLPGQE